MGTSLSILENLIGWRICPYFLTSLFLRLKQWSNIYYDYNIYTTVQYLVWLLETKLLLRDWSWTCYVQTLILHFHRFYTSDLKQWYHHQKLVIITLKTVTCWLRPYCIFKSPFLKQPTPLAPCPTQAKHIPRTRLLAFEQDLGVLEIISRPTIIPTIRRPLQVWN